jgi:Na+-driven multidrug efflux pump
MNLLIIPVSIILLSDLIQFNVSNIFKSLGLGGWAMSVFAICYYIFGLAVCILLRFVLNYGILGVWSSFVLAIVSVTIVYCAKYYMLDLDKLVN